MQGQGSRIRREPLLNVVGLTNMLWWHWIVLGLVLAGLEMASSGFFIIFFGAAAVLVGLFVLLGLAGPLWVEWLLFSILSILLLMVFRTPLMRRAHSPPRAEPIDSLTSDIATTLDENAPGAVGRAELRGSAWTARNVGQSSLAKGQRCTVRRVDGLMLHISAEGL